jgi:Ca2+-binding EF-hand superfamily protein
MFYLFKVREAMQVIYKEMQVFMNDSDLDKLIVSVDKNKDGRVQIDEFINLLV